MKNSVLIIDYGSQVTELIARKIRELNIYSELKNPDITLEEITHLAPKAIILSGGPYSVYEEGAPQIDQKIFDLGIPILGICYGQQLICHTLGGKVEKSSTREFGKAVIKHEEDSPLMHGVGDIAIHDTDAYPHLIETDHSLVNQVWMSHSDKVEKIPEGFKVIATTKDTPYAVIANEEQKIYGLQFHPEVSHSIRGHKIIENFILKIAKCEKNWDMGNFKDSQIKAIKETVGDKNVICGLSGGVDSSVVAALISRAIDKQLTCIFVDHGLLRFNEKEEVIEAFKDFDINFIAVDAKEKFLSKLQGVTDPEQKRKIIGSTFIEVFDEEAKKIDNVAFLAQGTLYPDVIESSHPNDGKSQTIKSHHNVGGLPEKMNLDLLEPVRMLFKDEVRKLGKELNLSDHLVYRHPFPGPGLAIRIIGDIDATKIDILQKADAIFIEEIKNADLYNKIWQAFSVLLPVKTVGVMGDNRTYENVLALRAVNSVDGMTAEVYNFESEFLNKVSTRIINEVHGINRVVYDHTSKPPGTIEWE